MSDMTMTLIGRTRRTGSVSGAQLEEWIVYGPAPLIVDVRDAWQYRQGHLDLAENIPVRTHAAMLVERVPDDGLLVLVCEDGLFSREVARMLEFCGLRQVVWLEGGMKSWNAARVQRKAA